MSVTLPKSFRWLLLMAGCLAATGQTAAAAVAGPTITVEAEGKVAAVPDLAMRLASGASAPATPIEVGEEEIKASVQAVFLVEP